MMKREKLKKKHWLLIEILIVVLIVIVLLNIVRIPVMHTEQYTEQQPMMVNGTAYGPTSPKPVAKIPPSNSNPSPNNLPPSPRPLPHHSLIIWPKIYHLNL